MSSSDGIWAFGSVGVPQERYFEELGPIGDLDEQARKVPTCSCRAPLVGRTVPRLSCAAGPPMIGSDHASRVD